MSIVEPDWNATIERLEQALLTGDAEQVASIAVAVTSGPLPTELVERASEVAERIGELERQISGRLDTIVGELDRIGPRPRRAAPPAPSQLDCSA